MPLTEHVLRWRVELDFNKVDTPANINKLRLSLGRLVQAVTTMDIADLVVGRGARGKSAVTPTSRLGFSPDAAAAATTLRWPHPNDPLNQYAPVFFGILDTLKQVPSKIWKALGGSPIWGSLIASMSITNVLATILEPFGSMMKYMMMEVLKPIQGVMMTVFRAIAPIFPLLNKMTQTLIEPYLPWLERIALWVAEMVYDYAPQIIFLLSVIAGMAAGKRLGMLVNWIPVLGPWAAGGLRVAGAAVGAFEGMKMMDVMQESKDPLIEKQIDFMKQQNARMRALGLHRKLTGEPLITQYFTGNVKSGELLSGPALVKQLEEQAAAEEKAQMEREKQTGLLGQMVESAPDGALGTRLDLPVIPAGVLALMK